MANEFNLEIVLDDRRLFKSLDDTEKKLEDIDKEAKKTGTTMSKAFDSADNSATKLNQELSKTEKQLDRTNKRARSAGGKLRSFRRDLTAAFTGAGIVAAFSQVQDVLQGLDDAIKQYRFNTNAAFAVNQRLKEATKDVSAEFVNEQAKVSALFKAIRESTEAGDENTDSKIDNKAAIQAINEQYGQYLPNLLSENSSLQDIEAAQKAVNAAIIERIALQVRQQAAQEIATEVFELTRLEQQYKRVQEAQEEAGGENNAFFRSLFGAPDVIDNIDIDAEVAKKRAKLQEEINILGASSDAFAEDLQNAFNSLGNEFFEQIGTQEEFNAAAEKTNTTLSKQAQEVSILDGSIADLNKQLQEVKKQQDEQAKTAEQLAPLIAEEERLNALIEEQKALRESLKTVTQEQIDEQIRLIEEAFLTEEQRAENNAIKQAQAREEEINAIRVDEAIKADLLKQNQELLNQDLKEINDRFRGEEAQVEIEAAQRRLDEQINLQQADLRAIQAAQLLKLQQTGATEEEITALQAEQEKQRQRLTLETEKKRLELVLEFAEGRSEAELQATRALIAGINTELQALDLDIPTPQTDEGGSFLSNLLGISDEEISAIKEAGAIALQQVQALADERARIAEENVQRRTDEVSRLNDLLANELQANEQGFASNVDALRERIAQEEAARQEALKQQARAQRTQILIDTATQASSLVTSSANIFKSLSALGPIGVGLAIATIATLFGAFAATKAQALQATKLYTGGRVPLGGHDDRNGGKGHRVEGTNLVVGAGEWVINRKASDKHNSFLNALNSGAYDDIDLMSVLEGAKAKDLNSLTINIQKQQRANSAQVQRNAIQEAIKAQTDKLGTQLENILTAPQVQVTEDGYYKVINSNNSTTINKIQLWQDQKKQPLTKQITQRYKKSKK